MQTRRLTRLTTAGLPNQLHCLPAWGWRDPGLQDNANLEGPQASQGNLALAGDEGDAATAADGGAGCVDLDKLRTPSFAVLSAFEQSKQFRTDQDRSG